MKLAPQFPTWQSITQTLALLGGIVGGIETARHPRVGVALIIAALLLFWVSRFLKPKSAV